MSEQATDFAVEFAAVNRYREWLGRQCADMGSPVVRAGAQEICRRHQEEIRGLQGDELEKMVEGLWLGYVSEARLALWAMLRATEGIYPVAQATTPPDGSAERPSISLAK